MYEGFRGYDVRVACESADKNQHKTHDHTKIAPRQSDLYSSFQHNGETI